MTAADQAIAAGLTARQIAEAAAQEQRDEAARILASVEARLAARRRDIDTIGAQLLRDSPLADWFPGVAWSWWDRPNPEGTYYHRYVVTPADGSQRSFFLMLNRSDKEFVLPNEGRDGSDDPDGQVRVWWAVERNDDGYHSWDCRPIVKSLDQLGELLLRQGERT